MKTKMKALLSIIALSLIAMTTSAQTIAMNFTGLDCNNNPVDLFADLDADKAVVLYFYMPNCGSCPPPAQKIQAMAEKINSNDPGRVKGYAYPYQNTTLCSSVQSWVTTNNLPLYAPMDSGAMQVAYYGGFGMPTVVLLGGNNHDVLFVSQNFTTSDTTTMRDLILGMSANLSEQNLKTKNSVCFFPNPSSDFVNINVVDLKENESYIVEILDLKGQKILKLEKTKIDSNIDVSNIPNGTYIASIFINQEIIHRKIEIIH